MTERNRRGNEADREGFSKAGRETDREMQSKPQEQEEEDNVGANERKPLCFPLVAAN